MRIILDRSEIEAFKRIFPCSGIPELSTLMIDYDRNGNLCDILATDDDGRYVDSATFDGAGLLALTQEYQPMRPWEDSQGTLALTIGRPEEA